MKRRNQKGNPFSAYVLDQLSSLSDLDWRPMFGCYGLYGQGHFFGIIWQGRLFFRTDDRTRPDYLKMGMEPFVFREKQSVNTYYEVPPSIVADARKLTQWASAAIDCQRRRAKAAPAMRQRRRRSSDWL